MSEPADLITPEGHVLIPAGVAGGLLDVLATSGRPAGREVRVALEALAIAETISSRRNPAALPERLEPVGASRWRTTTQAAEESGLTIRRVQQLAKSGKIQARSLDSRTWLIDTASLAEYLHRSNHDHHTTRAGTHGH